MKKFLKITGFTLLVLFIIATVFYLINDESLPTGVKGKKAETLAKKMMTSLNYEAFENTEIIEWSFREKHQYKWHKKENIVEVSWDGNKVLLHTKQPEKSEIITNKKNSNKQELIQTATDYFNNDSFWLIAPYKVFDKGVERRFVNYNGNDALLVTYTSGGTTPGDSYLWIFDNKGTLKSFKMWVKILPIGGLEASWNDWVHTQTGAILPKEHTLSLLGLKLKMGDVKTSNLKADAFAQKILQAVNHKAYKNTRYFEWSFRGKRFYKWDKTNHIVEVSWGNNKVILKPNQISESQLFINGKESEENKSVVVKKAEDYFNNDSFWLVAPHKLFEKGIIRSIVKIDNKELLKVKYTTGGTTPGDSYLWILDENYRPIKYLMNVPSLKMVLSPATWEDWITTESGTLLPKNHTLSSGFKLSMGDVKAYN